MGIQIDMELLRTPVTAIEMAQVIDAASDVPDVKIIIRRMAFQLEQHESSRSPAGYESNHSDSERLEWLLRNITGSELRDMGLTYAWTGDPDEARKLIDAKLDS
jgi:hypothetical protein